MAPIYQVRATGPVFERRDVLTTFDRDVVATLGELGALGQRLVDERTPTGVSSGGGGLRGSVFTELRGTLARREQIVASSSFIAPIVEEGRRSGKRPPLTGGGNLRLWVQRKLGISAAQLPSVTFLVARKIGAVGYKGYFMFERSFRQIEPIARQKFQDLGARMARELGGR
jgi:hypothetical protein